MNKWKTISLVLGLTTYIPIVIYLTYKVLKLVEATELMWFLFWIYVPVMIIIQIISKVAEDD